MEYKTCSLLNMCALNFNGRIDIDDARITFCCENLSDIPAIRGNEFSHKTLEDFMDLRNKILSESFKIGLMGEEKCAREVSSGCSKCTNFLPTSNIGNIDGLIHYINLSMYPAPCQCKCIYCGVHDSELARFNKEKHALYYDKLFDLLEYAREKSLIAKNVYWQVSTGEITIHPYKDRILELVKNDKACFFTNGFIFDEKISANLSANSSSSINLSIDAGTPKTWHKVKGVDNFEDVMMNLVKYFNNSSRPGQITLKYIILPGINDTVEDFNSVIEIMKILQCNHLTLARDTRVKYSLEAEETKRLIKAAGLFVALLSKNNISIDMYTYSPKEREAAVSEANELIKNKKV